MTLMKHLHFSLDPALDRVKHPSHTKYKQIRSHTQMTLTKYMHLTLDLALGQIAMVRK